MVQPSKKVHFAGQWDVVHCDVRFAHDGIHLDTTYVSSQPELSALVIGASKKATELARSSLDASISERLSQKGERRPNKLVAMTREWSFSEFLFRPHRVKISRSRVTHFYFPTQSPHWVFDYPGFYLEGSYNAAIGTFTDPEITDHGRTVMISFVPNGSATEFKYNLRLEAQAWNFGVDEGHAIIIIDPIMETSKL
jgi:hypothetical protein